VNIKATTIPEKHANSKDEQPDLHLHLNCTYCKAIFNLTVSKVPDIKLPNGFTSLGADLFVKGVCDKCKIG
jgi:Fur family ferric uptake transcriptional regulator